MVCKSINAHLKISTHQKIYKTRSTSEDGDTKILKIGHSIRSVNKTARIHQFI